MKIKKLTISLAALTAFCALAAPIKKNVVDEVAWIVGDEPIFRSEIEEQYMQARSEGTHIDGDPYCVIPEQIAVQKLLQDTICKTHETQEERRQKCGHFAPS